MKTCSFNGMDEIPPQAYELIAAYYRHSLKFGGSDTSLRRQIHRDIILANTSMTEVLRIFLCTLVLAMLFSWLLKTSGMI